MYKLVNIEDGTETQAICRIKDNAFIPQNEANKDYQEYLEWVADGGVVEPADE